jgi:hypothetical protein
VPTAAVHSNLKFIQKRSSFTVWEQAPATVRSPNGTPPSGYTPPTHPRTTPSREKRPLFPQAAYPPLPKQPPPQSPPKPTPPIPTLPQPTPDVPNQEFDITGDDTTATHSQMTKSMTTTQNKFAEIESAIRRQQQSIRQHQEELTNINARTLTTLSLVQTTADDVLQLTEDTTRQFTELRDEIRREAAAQAVAQRTGFENMTALFQRMMHTTTHLPPSEPPLTQPAPQTPPLSDSIQLRDPSTTRIFFQNVKGLTYTATGEDYGYYLASVSSIGADITGMAETNSTWDHFHLRHTFHASARKQFQLHKVSFSSPSTLIDPIPDTESFQSGGTLTLTTNNLVPMALGETHNDLSVLGRWSSITLRGKEEDHILTIFTAYRVCKGNIQSSPVGSSFSREYVHHKQNGHPNPQPRKIFLTDITSTIQNLQTKGHAILLMLDSNRTLKDDDNLQQLLLNCDLSDLHEFAPSPSTFIGSQHRRIDHMVGCPQTLSALTASGSLSYAEGPQSDHRGLFVDLDTNSLLKQDNKSPSFSPSASRSLKSGNPEAVATYHEAMLQYYADHQMETRLHALIEAKDSLPTPTLSKLLKTWDADQGRAMKHAETLLERPKKPYAWSPTLRNAGLLCRYWRLRLREKMRSENYNDTYYRLEHQTQQHDPTFILPFRGIPLPISEITQQLKDAKVALPQWTLSCSQN